MKKAFPLYDQLKARTEPIKSDDWKKLCAIINNLPDDQLEHIYALMIHHAMCETNPPYDVRKPPYNGKTFESGKGIVFKLNSIPAELQNIIGHYVQSTVVV